LTREVLGDVKMLDDIIEMFISYLLAVHSGVGSVKVSSTVVTTLSTTFRLET